MKKIFRITGSFTVGSVIGCVVTSVLYLGAIDLHEKPYHDGYEDGLKQGRKECIQLIKSTK